MLQQLNQLIIRCSFSLWKFVSITLGFFGCLQLLLFIGEKFKPYANGAVPFDLQNSLTSQEIFAQLANYAEQAFPLYYVFTAIDYAFPLLAGLFLAVIWAYVLRHNLPRWYEIALQRNLFVLLLIPTLFDWLENMTLLATIIAFPYELSSAADAAVVVKQAKLATTYTAQGATALILTIGLLLWMKRRLSR
jgi:hypothetical protein